MDFNTIPIYTKTIIIATNLHVNLSLVSSMVEVVPFVLEKKKKGRKQKDKVDEPILSNAELLKDAFQKYQLKCGDIITIIPENGNLIGWNKKNVVFVKGVKNRFRNAISVNMFTGEKIVNFKITTNGKFQITGCKDTNDAIICLKEMIFKMIHLKGINLDGPDIPWITKDNVPFEAIIFIVMNNKTFHVGFNICKTSLHKLANVLETDYISSFENGMGYTGLVIKQITDKNIDWKFEKLSTTDGLDWTTTMVGYDEYLNMLTPLDRKKELAKSRRVTFLIFQSGKVIITGIHPSKMETPFYEFLNFVNSHKEEIMN